MYRLLQSTTGLHLVWLQLVPVSEGMHLQVHPQSVHTAGAAVLLDCVVAVACVLQHSVYTAGAAALFVKAQHDRQVGAAG